MKSNCRIDAGKYSKLTIPKVKRFFLRLVARALLRAESKDPLSEELEALLEQKGLIDTAHDHPKTSHLRPYWDAYKKYGEIPVIDRTIERSIDYQGQWNYQWPDNVYVACEPLEILKDIFNGKLALVDELLEQLSSSNFLKEVLRKDFFNSLQKDSLVSYRIDQKNHEMQIWIGLSYQLQNAHCDVLCYCNGVFLCKHTLENIKIRAKVLIQSTKPIWHEFLAHKDHHETWLAKVVASALPDALILLKRAFPNPPPPLPLSDLDIGLFGSDFLNIPPTTFWGPYEKIGRIAAWQRTMKLQITRQHIDDLLGELSTEQINSNDFLWDWPLFYGLNRQAYTLNQLLEESKGKIHFVKEQAWSRKSQKELVFNLTESQIGFLKRVEKFTLVDVSLSART